MTRASSALRIGATRDARADGGRIVVWVAVSQVAPACAEITPAPHVMHAMPINVTHVGTAFTPTA